MNTYDVWWKEIESNMILHQHVEATSKEDAKQRILHKFGYKLWDVKFTKYEINNSY